MGNDDSKTALAFDASAAAGAPREREYVARCERCGGTLSEAQYVEAEQLAGLEDDPACPDCGLRAWAFFLVD